MVHQGQAWSTTASTALPDSLSGALHERDAVGQRPIEGDRLSCRHRCRYCFRRLFLQAPAASSCCWRRSAPRSAAAGSPPVSGEAGRLGEGVSLEEHQEDASPRSAWGRSGREQCGGGCARQGSLRVARPVKKRGESQGRPGSTTRRPEQTCGGRRPASFARRSLPGWDLYRSGCRGAGADYRTTLLVRGDEPGAGAQKLSRNHGGRSGTRVAGSLRAAANGRRLKLWDPGGLWGRPCCRWAGVALGAGGSLFGQYLLSRTSTRQLEVQESAAHRAELKDAVLTFLALASQVEKAALARSAVVAP